MGYLKTDPPAIWCDRGKTCIAIAFALILAHSEMQLRASVLLQKKLDPLQRNFICHSSVTFCWGFPATACNSGKPDETKGLFWAAQAQHQGVGMAVLSFSPSRGTTLYKAYRTPIVAARTQQMFCLAKLDYKGTELGVCLGSYCRFYMVYIMYCTHALYV